MADLRKTASVVGVWVLSLGLVVLPWAAFSLVDVPALEDWASVYIVGALGGLVLEFAIGRGRVELPGVSPADADESADERRPLGTQIDIGFLARMTSSGLAAVAFLLLYYSLIDKADATEFAALANEPQTYGWAIFFGVSSPAVWAAGRRLVESRIGAVEAKKEAEKAEIAAQSEAQTAVVRSENAHLVENINRTMRTLEAAAPAAPLVPAASAVSTVAATLPPVLQRAIDAPAGELDLDDLLADFSYETELQAVVDQSQEVSSAIQRAIGIASSALPNR